MKQFIALSALFLLLSHTNLIIADDDVYSPPKPREVRVKQTPQAPAETEKTVPYEEENSNTSSRQQPVYSDNDGGNYQTDNYSDDGWNSSYSDRIRRFHNPSIRYSVGWSLSNSYWNDPFYSYNSFGNSWNSPYYSYGSNIYSPYGYNDFYYPYYGSSTVIVFNDPWSNCYNPYYGYGYSPTCASIIYNNAYPYYYGGGYESPRRNVVNTPRTGGYYNNTNNTNGRNYNYNYPSNSGYNRGNTQQQTPKKYSNPNSGTNSQSNDTYKYHQPAYNNSGNTHRENTPSNNGNWGNSNDNSGRGGVKIGSRPK
jgi:hypothetical protein